MSANFKRSSLLLALVLWEAYWAYVFFAAPNPDEKMDSVFALLMAVLLPFVLGAFVGLGVLGGYLGRRKP